ncbi:hypothetical protein L1887_19777 [Cichorium endivia]|nr:hypothetical protein L1887_19777 [Cichorium endivia]
MSNSNSGNRNTTLLLLIASIVLTSPVYGTSPDSDIIESSCITTLYPDICYSTLSTTKNLATKKDVIQHTINKTKEIIRGSFNTIKNLTATDNLNKRCKIALHDCIEMVAGTLEDLDMVIRELKAYPTKKSLRRHANDLLTLMSTTITNKETCLDDLSYDPACKQLCNSIIQGQDLGGKMCSNVLAMIKNMTHTDMANKPELDVEHVKEEMWPEWLSMKDRKLLGLLDITPHVTVAKDGKGNYTTVEEAVEEAPEKSLTRYVIKIKEGVYEEYVRVPKSKKNLMFIGDGKDKTIITGNKNVADGNSTTWQSATVAAMGNGFLARDITFQNTAGPSGHQAVALRVGSDLSAFYRCAILGYQDTLYGTTGRQFYVNCEVVGTIDFIFGNAAAVFQFCDILVQRPNRNQKNMVTAQGRIDANQNTGIVIQKSKISATPELQEVQANFSTYLGRPWKNYSRTVVMESMISDVIEPKGWHPWDGDFALDTLYYREYENIGPGADTSERVNWTGWGVMKTRLEAIPFTAGPFINGLMWLPTTGFPFWPGW